MTDFKEEQRTEMEALESIYPSELTILSDDPYHSFTIAIQTEASKIDNETRMAVTLKFTYVPSYPDEPPLTEVEESENVDDEDITDLLSFLQCKAEENVGMVMVFTLVYEATEWLNKRLQDNETRKIEEEEQRLQKEEEEERTHFEGTRVTVETFMTWKAKFDQEMLELTKQQIKEDALSKKLTGRELFEKDKTLVDSDLQFLQEGEEEVKVDESLFQELDDIELNDEELSE